MYHVIVYATRITLDKDSYRKKDAILMPVTITWYKMEPPDSIFLPVIIQWMQFSLSNKKRSNYSVLLINRLNNRFL